MVGSFDGPCPKFQRSVRYDWPLDDLSTIRSQGSVVRRLSRLETVILSWRGDVEETPILLSLEGDVLLHL